MPSQMRQRVQVSVSGEDYDVLMALAHPWDHKTVSQLVRSQLDQLIVNALDDPELNSQVTTLLEFKDHDSKTSRFERTGHLRLIPGGK